MRIDAGKQVKAWLQEEDVGGPLRVMGVAEGSLCGGGHGRHHGPLVDHTHWPGGLRLYPHKRQGNRRGKLPLTKSVCHQTFRATESVCRTYGSCLVLGLRTNRPVVVRSDPVVAS